MENRPYIIIPAGVRPTVDPTTVAAYDMRQSVAGVVSDLSGSGNNITLINNPLQVRNIFGNFLKFNGTSQYGTFASTISLSGEFTIAFRVTDSNPVNKFVLGNVTSDIKIGWGVSGFFIRVVTLGSSYQFALSTTEHSNALIVITRDSANKIDFYYNDETAVRCFSDVAQAGTTIFDRICRENSGANFFDGALCAPVIYNECKDASWVAAEYAKGQWALWKSNAVPITGNVTSGFIGESPWTVLGGTWAVADYTINSNKVRALDNIAAGQCIMPTSIMGQSPTEAARGYWEYWVYKTSTTSNIYIQFASNDKGFIDTAGNYSYHLTIQSDGVMRLRKSVNGALTVLDTSSNFPLDAWTKVSIYWDEGGGDVRLNDVSEATTTDVSITEANYQRISTLGADNKVCLGSTPGFGAPTNYSIVKRLLS